MNIELNLVRRMLNLPMLRWSQEEMWPLIELLPMNCRIAELGCFAGESSQQFARDLKTKLLVCVDNWLSGYDMNDRASQADMDAARSAFNVRMSPHKNFVIHDMPTALAVEIYPDEFFDMVYIDADHRYEAVAIDITMWRPKIKKGGIIAGHDFETESHQGVTKAVLDCLRQPEFVFPDSSWAIRI